MAPRHSPATTHVAFAKSPGGNCPPSSCVSRGTRTHVSVQENAIAFVTRVVSQGAKGPTDESTISLPHPTSETDHQTGTFDHAKPSPNNSFAAHPPPPLEHVSSSFMYSICQQSIPTNTLANFPINVSNFEAHLAAHPDRAKVDYLITGLRHGFRLGFHSDKVKPGETEISKRKLSLG